AGRADRSDDCPEAPVRSPAAPTPRPRAGSAARPCGYGDRVRRARGPAGDDSYTHTNMSMTRDPHTKRCRRSAEAFALRCRTGPTHLRDPRALPDPTCPTHATYPTSYGFGPNTSSTVITLIG